MITEIEKYENCDSTLSDFNDYVITSTENIEVIHQYK